VEVLQDIIQIIDDYLVENTSVREFELIQHLKRLGQEPFSEFNISVSKDLFRAHFLLKHALYNLQNIYFQEAKFVLDIGLVHIIREPFVSGESSLTSHDSVKAYYLDISHYFETEEDEVNDLLNQFWRKFLVQDDKQAALSVLELPLAADYSQVKMQYKKLAQLHHPDKGGCEERFKKISAAKRLLDRAMG
jgi:hypothetical protein